jgi:hypothetical protein
MGSIEFLENVPFWWNSENEQNITNSATQKAERIRFKYA